MERLSNLLFSETKSRISFDILFGLVFGLDDLVSMGKSPRRSAFFDQYATARWENPKCLATFFFEFPARSMATASRLTFGICGFLVYDISLYCKGFSTLGEHKVLKVCVGFDILYYICYASGGQIAPKQKPKNEKSIHVSYDFVCVCDSDTSSNNGNLFSVRRYY